MDFARLLLLSEEKTLSSCLAAYPTCLATVSFRRHKTGIVNVLANCSTASIEMLVPHLLNFPPELTQLSSYIMCLTVKGSGLSNKPTNFPLLKVALRTRIYFLRISFTLFKSKKAIRQRKVNGTLVCYIYFLLRRLRRFQIIASFNFFLVLEFYMML